MPRIEEDGLIGLRLIHILDDHQHCGASVMPIARLIHTGWLLISGHENDCVSSLFVCDFGDG
jgi:hypothetical protein